MELFNNAKDIELKKRIHNEDYYNDFIQTANNIIPDGERITIAGFTSISDGKEKRVSLTRVSKKTITKTEKRIDQLISVSGKLQFGKIFILDDKGNEYPLIIPDDKKNEVIKNLTEGEVLITGVQTKRGIKLENIQHMEIKSYLNLLLPPPNDFNE